jgi:hypothetical protein
MSRPKGLPKTGGRKKGVQNRPKMPDLRKMLEAKLQAEATVGEQLPLSFLLSIMRDESYPPGLRVECANASLPFCHAKMADQPSAVVQQITEVRRVIVSPRTDPDYQDNAVRLNGDREIAHQVVEPGVIRGAMPAEQEGGGLHWSADPPDEVASDEVASDGLRDPAGKRAVGADQADANRRRLCRRSSVVEFRPLGTSVLEAGDIDERLRALEEAEETRA